MLQLLATRKYYPTLSKTRTLSCLGVTLEAFEYLIAGQSPPVRKIRVDILPFNVIDFYRKAVLLAMTVQWNGYAFCP